VYAWDGDAWRDAACGEGYDRHPHENWLTVHVCHLTDFGLLGQSAAVGGVTRPLRVGSLLVKSGAYLMTVVVTVGLAAIVYGGGSRRKR